MIMKNKVESANPIQKLNSAIKAKETSGKAKEKISENVEDDMK